MISPPYRDRVRIPHQARPPAHSPEPCDEVVSHEWLRVWRCPIPECAQVHEYRRDEMRDSDSLTCYGSGVCVVAEEPWG